MSAEDITPNPMRTLRRAAGFVLVLGIAGLVLYGLFAPSIFYAPVRADVSRARMSMRTLATAIESYYIDHQVYPAYATTLSEGGVQRSGSQMPYPAPRLRNETALAALTTPFAYLSGERGMLGIHHDIADPFAEIEGRGFAYYTPGDGTNSWILFSPGPDRIFDLGWNAFGTIYDPVHGVDFALLFLYSYDPTNGTITSGDVWRVKQ